MKRIVLGLLIIMPGLYLQGQDQASLKPLLKQIALLKTYITYLEKGYDIARKGLNTIGDIKNGHWRMDIAYFNSLKNVNPKIKSYAKVAMIAEEQAQIIKICSRLKKSSFNADEVSYINAVVEFLLNDCRTLADEVVNVITNGKMQLSDDERLKAIDRTYEDMHEAYGFIKNYYEQVKLLNRARAKERYEIEVSKKLNGL